MSDNQEVGVGSQLSWGRHYLAVRPDHFRVEYAINPFMDTHVQPDPVRTHDEWSLMIAAIEAAGGRVDVLGQRMDSPDMVYAMNLGLALDDRVVMSHMRYPERRHETLSAADWFGDHGFKRSWIGRDAVGAHFEAGDAFAWQGDLVVGYGPRTEEQALKHLADDLGVTVRGFQIVHPGMYHMDLAFCPLSATQAMVCPSAFDADSAQALLDLVPDPLVLTEEEALSTFCANSIVVDNTVIMPACPDRVRAQLEEWGFEVVIVEVAEFLKGGGAIRCLTNPLDVRLGRDLTVGGSRVVLGAGN